MASCMRGCWGVFSEELRKLRRPAHLRGRTYRRARYSEKELSIEFENLIDEEDFNPRPRRILTETETELITQKRYNDLVEQQKKLDAEIDAQLSRREDDLRLEEEAYYEAKREAARVAKQARQMEENKASKEKDKRVRRGFLEDSSLSSWLSDDGFSVDSTELDVEDFDAFLEKVKARSLGGSSPFTYLISIKDFTVKSHHKVVLIVLEKERADIMYPWMESHRDSWKIITQSQTNVLQICYRS